jgi:hypothetical protein
VPGIDHIFSKAGPPMIVLIVDSKYGTAELSTLADGTPQMSRIWIRDRLADVVGRKRALEILDDGYSSLMAKVSPEGMVEYFLLDENGDVVGAFTQF